MATPRWITAAEVEGGVIPPGGAINQVLAKESNTDYDLKWADSGGGGGSFLSVNTARVDPSGSDETGTVGDLSKPFLTVQAALDELAVNDTGGGIRGGIILLPATQLVETLTLSIPAADATIISFKGQRGPPSGSFKAFFSLTITASTPETGTVEIFLEDCTLQDNITTNVATFFLYLNNVDFNGATITLSEGCADATIGGFGNTSGNIGYILQGQAELTLFGVWSPSSNTEITNDSATVNIIDCKPRPDEWQSYAGVSVNDGTETGDGGSVNARNSVLGDVTAGFITCVDSRIVGSVTTTADPTVDYQDVFLKGVPPGGTTGQALEKASNDDFDTSWESLV